MLANALNRPPGEYSRKAETQTNWRGGAQPVEHVVQFDTKRWTLPGFEMYLQIPRNRDSFEGDTQLLHGCRQLVTWVVLLSEVTSATPIVCYCIIRDCPALFCWEEGGDDVKSSWCLYPGLHTSYNGLYRGLQYRKVELIPKTSLSWDCRLKFACMNLELVVIANQQIAVNTFSPLAHTARQINKVEGTQYLWFVRD